MQTNVQFCIHSKNEKLWKPHFSKTYGYRIMVSTSMGSQLAETKTVISTFHFDDREASRQRKR